MMMVVRPEMIQTLHFDESKLKQANRLRQSRRGAKKQIRRARFLDACED